MKIKKGDTVIVITGKDKGKSGKVVRALPKESRVLVEGVNMRKKHLKKKRDTKQGGGIVERALPIHVSNVMTLDSKSGKGTRVGYTTEGKKGSKKRIAKSSGTVIS